MNPWNVEEILKYSYALKDFVTINVFLNLVFDCPSLLCFPPLTNILWDFLSISFIYMYLWYVATLAKRLFWKYSHLLKKHFSCVFSVTYRIEMINPTGLTYCNWTRTQNHLVLKRTLNHLAKLVNLITNTILTVLPFMKFIW